MVFVSDLRRLILFAAISVVVKGDFVPPPLKDTPPVPDGSSSPEIELIKRFVLPNPEDVAVDPTETYFVTGARNGYVYKVDIASGFYELIFGPKDFRPEFFANSTDEEIRALCDGSDEATCGSVLGIKFEFDSTTNSCKSIWLANAYFGIFEGSCSEPYTLERRIGIEGGFVNNLQPHGNHLYYTVSHSTKQRDQLPYVVLDDDAPGGTLHRLDTSNNYEMEELASGIYFANGLAASTDGLSIYVSETSAARIRRYEIETGILKPFLDDIPVLTDNILVQDGDLLVPGYTRNATMEALMTNLTALEEFLAQGPGVVGPAFSAMVAPHGNLLIYDEATGNLKERIFQGSGGKFVRASSAHKLGDGYLVGSSFFPGATWFRLAPTDEESTETGDGSTEEEEEEVPSSAAKSHIGFMFLAAVVGAGATAMMLFFA